MNELRDLFNPSGTTHPALFAAAEPWEPIRRLAGYLQAETDGEVRADVHPTAVIEGRVSIGASTKVDALAIVRGTVIVGENCFIGRALVRDSLIESGVLIGNGCEIARSVILKGAQIPHNSVILDSIVGAGVNVGGGTLLGNLNLNNRKICVEWGERRVDTGLIKLGSILGDGCKVGMGCLIYPGVILGQESVVGAGVHLNGSYSPRTYVKAIQPTRTVTLKRRRNAA